jgi:hypothetical protein
LGSTEYVGLERVDRPAELQASARIMMYDYWNAVKPPTTIARALEALR